jgi:hypothetical protein
VKVSSGSAFLSSTALLEAQEILSDVVSIASDIDIDADRAEAARDASLLSSGLYASTAQGIGLGVRSIAITAAGSGGTNGTWPWATTGGTAVIGATGTVTIVGGAVVAVNVNQHGLYTVAPTAIAITGAGALTGFTYAMTNAVNTAVNGYFSVPVTGSETAANLYRVDSGPVATFVTNYASAAISTSVRALNLTAGLPVASKRLLDTSGSITPSLYRICSWTNGVTYELVAVARAYEGRDRINLYILGTGVSANIDFNLTLGVATITAGLAVMTALGGGWYECRAQFTATATSSGGAGQLRPSIAGTFPFTGDTSKGVMVDSFQFREVGGANIWPSSDPADASFTKPLLTVAAATSPEDRTAAHVGTAELSVAALNDAMFGSMDLWRWVEAAGAGLQIRRYRTLTTVNAATYRFVFRGKPGTRKRIGFYSNVGVVVSASFNLDLLTSVLHSGTATLTIRHLVNGTVEWTVETVATSAATTNIQLYVLNDTSLPAAARTGDGVSDIYAHSLQAYKDGAALWLGDADLFSTAPWTGSSLTLTANAAQYLGVLGSTQPAAAAAAVLQGMKVDIIGNSLAAGLWPAVFAGLSGADIAVHATGGASLGLDARPSPHYGSGVMTAHLADVRADAQIVIIDQPVNDFGASCVPLGVITDTTTATEYGALRNASEWLNTNRPNAKLIFVVPTSAGPGHASHSHANGANAAGFTLLQYQQAAREMGQLVGRPVFDPNAFNLSMLDADENTSDLLHYDASGALKFSRALNGFFIDLADYGWLED